MIFYVGRKPVGDFIHAKDTLCSDILTENNVSGLSFVEHGDSMRIYMVTDYQTTRSYLSASLNGPLSRPITINSLLSGEILNNMNFHWELSLHGNSPITTSEELSFNVWNSLILNAPDEFKEYVDRMVEKNSIEAQMGISFSDMAMRILEANNGDSYVPLWVPHYPGYYFTSELGEMSNGELGIEFDNGMDRKTISILTSHIESYNGVSTHEHGPDIVMNGLNALSEKNKMEAINYLKARKGMLETIIDVIEKEGENGFLQQQH